MNVEPISHEWAARTFPAVFQVFGSPLRRQVEAFAEITGERPFPSDDIDIVWSLMAREFTDTHRPILNTLSLFPDRGVPPEGKAMLVLLEQYLAYSLAKGDDVRTYRDMLRSGQAYMNLIAELDWACRLRASGGTFRPHTPTDPASGGNDNFDINWERAGQTLRGDVKWFKDWLVRSRGTDLLSGQIKLLRPGLRHDLVVTARMRDWTVGQVIDAALEASALYDAAVAGREDPSWALGREGQRVDLRLRAAYEIPPPERLLLVGVTVHLGRVYDPGKGHVSVVESGAGGEDDQEAARRNLARAASQTPPPQRRGDVSCVFIGSALESDAEDVDAVLHCRLPAGHPQRLPGLFDPGSPVAGYAHLNAAVHFSINFARREAGSQEVVVSRTARLFQGPNGLDDAQRAFLDAALGEVIQDTTLAVQ